MTGRPDPMLIFREVADVIIIREFLPNRGCKENFPTTKNLTCKYHSYQDAYKQKLGLTVSTSSFPSRKDVLSLAASLLLPGKFRLQKCPLLIKLLNNSFLSMNVLGLYINAFLSNEYLTIRLTGMNRVLV